MCWITQQEPIEELAKKDIPVYKIVKSNLQAYYFQEFKYAVGETFYSIMGWIDFQVYGVHAFWQIGHGLHSYSYECPMEGPYVYNPTRTRRLSGYVHCKTAKLHCVIPKGSTYYVNNDGEYVSSYLKVLSAEILVAPHCCK